MRNNAENSLIRFLESRKDLSVASLKKLYWKLCKETHPDREGGSQEKFLTLQTEYAEALLILSKRHPRPSALAAGEARETLLRNLYLHALKIFSQDGQEYLACAVEAARQYDGAVHGWLVAYDDVFMKNARAWRDEGNVFYAHNHFLAIVKQMFYYFVVKQEMHKRLFRSLAAEMPARCTKLEERQSAILRGLVDWLGLEIGKGWINTDM